MAFSSGLARMNEISSMVRKMSLPRGSIGNSADVQFCRGALTSTAAMRL
jgi:hypothetical protein